MASSCLFIILSLYHGFFCSWILKKTWGEVDCSHRFHNFNVTNLAFWDDWWKHGGSWWKRGTLSGNPLPGGFLRKLNCHLCPYLFCFSSEKNWSLFYLSKNKFEENIHPKVMENFVKNGRKCFSLLCFFWEAGCSIGVTRK